MPLFGGTRLDFIVFLSGFPDNYFKMSVPTVLSMAGFGADIKRAAKFVGICTIELLFFITCCGIFNKICVFSDGYNLVVKSMLGDTLKWDDLTVGGGFGMVLTENLKDYRSRILFEVWFVSDWCVHLFNSL